MQVAEWRYRLLTRHSPIRSIIRREYPFECRKYPTQILLSSDVSRTGGRQTPSGLNVIIHTVNKSRFSTNGFAEG